MWWRLTGRSTKAYKLIEVPCINTDCCDNKTSIQWDYQDKEELPTHLRCSECRVLHPSYRGKSGMYSDTYGKNQMGVEFNKYIPSFESIYLAETIGGDDEPSRFYDYALEREGFDEPGDDCDLLQLFGASY